MIKNTRDAFEPQIQGCMEKIKQMDVSEEKKIQLCNVLAGIENQNQRGKLEMWHKFIELIFNDNSIIEEIYKKMKTNGLCFLNNVGIFFDDSISPKFMLYKNLGRKTQKVEKEWNSKIYYDTNIKECTQQIMTIPIDLLGKYGHHSNMLIIKKNTTTNQVTWEIEHFEPHGRQFSEEVSVNKAVQELVHDILINDPEYNKDNIKITHPNQLCRLTEPIDKILQQILDNTKYEGSCTIFSMWYSFNRILYPQKESEQIYKEMNDTLNKSTNPSKTIENIISTFLSLINIDIDNNKFEVGNSRLLADETIYGIELPNIISHLREQNPIFTIRGNSKIRKLNMNADFFDNKENIENLMKKEEIHFFNCILPYNFTEWAENKTALKVFEIVDCDFSLPNRKMSQDALLLISLYPGFYNLLHLKINNSILFDNNINIREFLRKIFKNIKRIETIDLGNNGIDFDTAKTIYQTLDPKSSYNLNTIIILDTDNKDPRLNTIQIMINEFYRRGGGEGKKKREGKKRKGKKQTKKIHSNNQIRSRKSKN